MNQEELLQRAAEERETIVARYKKGRQAGAEIDPWEDPQFEIYHVLDRYGFIHDQHDPDKQNAAEVRLEMERVKKWVKMLRNWDSNATKEKLRKRVYKGVPNSLRGQVWSKMLNLPTVREEQSGKYQEMRELAWRWSPDIRQIDLDVNRTYRDHIMFRERYNIKQQELFNVLGAYSVYNLEIGYCQGMSQIAALLLMYLDEEDAFWALSVLVSDRKFNMHGFFIPGFPKLLRYQEHHDKIMNKFLPKLKKHLDKNGVDTGIYTLKWFFQCFLDRIPFKLTLRVWDVYLLEGERVLTAMAYNILKMHRRNLSKRGMDDILQYLQVGLHQVHLEQNYEFEEDVTMESLQKCMDELRRAKLDYAGAPPSHELPKRPFGLFKEPAFEQKVGRRSSEFSTAERTTQENVMMRRELAAAAALASPPTPHGANHANGHAAHAAQRLSSGGDVTALPGRSEIHSCNQSSRTKQSLSRKSFGLNSFSENSQQYPSHRQESSSQSCSSKKYHGKYHSSHSRDKRSSRYRSHGQQPCDPCDNAHDRRDVNPSFEKFSKISSDKNINKESGYKPQSRNSHSIKSNVQVIHSHHRARTYEPSLLNHNSNQKSSYYKSNKHQESGQKLRGHEYYDDNSFVATDKLVGMNSYNHKSNDNTSQLFHSRIKIHREPESHHKKSGAYNKSSCKSSDCEFFSCESGENSDCQINQQSKCCQFYSKKCDNLHYVDECNVCESYGSYLSWSNTHRHRSIFQNAVLPENHHKSSRSRRSNTRIGLRHERFLEH